MLFRSLGGHSVALAWTDTESDLPAEQRRAYEQPFRKVPTIHETGGIVPIEEADMIVEITRPDIGQLFRKSETLSDISERVEKATENGYCLSDLSDVCYHLLKTASKKLQLFPVHIKRIIGVAQTIAQLDGSTIIEPQHLLEAIQYQSFDRTQSR